VTVGSPKPPAEGIDRVGPLRVADTTVVIDTAESDFAAIATWSFGDLVDRGDADVTAGHVFEVKRSETPQKRWEIWRDGHACHLALEEGYTLFHLQWELNRIVLERRANTIHAAAAAIDDRCVVVVGGSGSGKTTLAGYLTAHGAEYVGDEVVAVDETFAAVPYQRPLGLRFGGPLESLFTVPPELDRRLDRYELLVPVSAFGGDTAIATRPVPIGALVFAAYRPDAPSTVTPLCQADAMQRLCKSAPGIERGGRAAFRHLAQLVARTPIIELSVSDLEVADAQVRAVLAETSA
jgi:hypothetical protein